MTLLAAAVVVLLGGGLAALAAFPRPALALALGSGTAAAGCGLGLAAVLPVLAGAPAASLRLPWRVPAGAFHVRLDPLAAFFETALFGVGLAAALYGASYLRPSLGRRPVPSFAFFFNVLVASMALVFAAADAVLFLVAWEVMALSAFALVTFEHERVEVRSAGYVFLVASHLGTAFLFGLFLLLGRGTGSFDFGRIEALRASPAVPASLLFCLALVGFGTKAGLVPLHVWLPEAHPAAPSHVSALLSAVMIKTGIYGILRTLTFLPPAPAGWGYALGGVGLLGALVAITQASGQNDVKRALAYSSVENVGLIALGLGMGMVGAAAGSEPLAALGYGGALLHVWNHALMKGLAFMGAGALVHATHTRDMERMGGLLARMPRSGALFLVAAAALAGLPPLNGFASEWLLYLGLLLGAGGMGGGPSLLGYLAFTGLALVGALAAIAFARLAGVALLGAPRSPEAAAAREVGPGMWAPLGLLGAGCVALGLFPAEVLRLVAPVLAQMGGPGLPAALGPPAATLGTPLRAVAVVLLVLAVGLALLRRRVLLARGARASETWGCGFGRPTERMEYTGSSFAQFLLVGLAPRALRPRGHLLPPRGIFPARASLRTEPLDPARARLFDPAFRALGDRMSRLRRFQAERLNLQLLYTLITLVVLASAVALQARWPWR